MVVWLWKRDGDVRPQRLSPPRRPVRRVVAGFAEHKLPLGRQAAQRRYLAANGDLVVQLPHRATNSTAVAPAAPSAPLRRSEPFNLVGNVAPGLGAQNVAEPVGDISLLTGDFRCSGAVFP